MNVGIKARDRMISCITAAYGKGQFALSSAKNSQELQSKNKVLTCACTARWKAPFLKGSRSPCWLRVPSGNTHSRICAGEGDKKSHCTYHHPLKQLQLKFIYLVLQHGFGGIAHDVFGVARLLTVDEDDAAQPADETHRARVDELFLGDRGAAVG